MQNPFLNAACRAALQAVGIGPNDSFVVSRTSQGTFPALYSLDIGGGVRRTEQDGEAPTFRNFVGQLVTQKANGEPQNITTINANWSSFPSLRFSGERTRAVRQPNTVELFLGGQPASNGADDPCSNANITAGANPEVCRANCIADVIAEQVVGPMG